MTGTCMLPRNHSGEFDPRVIADDVQSYLAEDSGVMEAHLQDLPEDEVYEADSPEEDSGANGGPKKQRSWFGKMGKGLYRRTIGGKKDKRPSDGRDDGTVRALVMGCRAANASETGGVACQDPMEMRVCRSVLSLMVKQMGRNLLSGGNVMNVSFPIQCCAPRTVLEIGAAMGQYFHHYMPRAAAASNDPVERMKNVVACFVAAMPLTSGNFMKPLNPLLGETLQVELTCTHVDMCVAMHACRYLSICLSIYACMSVCMSVCLSVCMYVCMYVYVCVYVYVCITQYMYVTKYV